MQCIAENQDNRTNESRESPLEIATQVAAGLAAVYKQKPVHWDIKPSNIMVRLAGEGSVTAKIIDLGLAKPAPDA
jgi:serine/threonine protein kinase